MWGCGDKHYPEDEKKPCKDKCGKWTDVYLGDHSGLLPRMYALLMKNGLRTTGDHACSPFDAFKTSNIHVQFKRSLSKSSRRVVFGKWFPQFPSLAEVNQPELLFVIEHDIADCDICSYVARLVDFMKRILDIFVVQWNVFGHDWV
jgi:hypothetical protein